MRGIAGLLLLAAMAGGRTTGVGGITAPEISVGGTYQTTVTLERSSCPGQTVQTHPTVVTQVPGDTILSLMHAGSTYTGTLAADGSFTTPAVTQVFGSTSYRIGIVGRFSTTAIDALVTVEAGLQPPCSFTARWAGPKSGAPNVIP